MLAADDPAVVREVLLGREGPYADPRVALDPLDNLAVWLQGADAADVRCLADSLMALLADPDPVVATGAALGLGMAHASAGEVSAARVLAVIDGLGPMLERPPVGFNAATGPTILADITLVVARSASPGDDELVSRLLDERPGGLTVDAIASAAAPRFPDLILAGARRWLTSSDTGTLVRLPTHWHRVALAGALRPYSGEAIERVSVAASMVGWDPADTAALQAVMRDDYPELTTPTGVGGDDRWWIEAGSPYGPVVWRSLSGSVALEVLRDGMAMTMVSRVLSAELVAAYRAGGIAALSATADELRR